MLLLVIDMCLYWIQQLVICTILKIEFIYCVKNYTVDEPEMVVNLLKRLVDVIEKNSTIALNYWPTIKQCMEMKSLTVELSHDINILLDRFVEDQAQLEVMKQEAALRWREIMCKVK